jgi:hypothetical protein
MKAKFNVKPKHSDYDLNKIFTYGVEYDVLADYRNRQSGQAIRDNGLVVVDNQGTERMVFLDEFKIIDDGKQCFTFN